MVMLNGFSKISTAPACRAWFLTVNSGKAVVMITGMFRVAGFAFKRAIILSPIMSGKYIHQDQIRMHLQCFADCVSARTGFDNVVAEMIENFHKQFSPVVVVFDYQYFFIHLQLSLVRFTKSASLPD
jgi:hypothetical protein